MNIPTAIVFATADCLALHLQKQGSHCVRVSEVRFNGLKSSRDSSRQYSSKKMHPRRLFLGRVSIATGARDSATNKNKRFKGVRPQLICAATDLASKPLADFVPGAQAEPSGGDNGKNGNYYLGFRSFFKV